MNPPKLAMADDGQKKAEMDDIVKVDLPEPLVISEDNRKRLNAFAGILGYPDEMLDKLHQYAEVCRRVADHYRSEAFRMRDGRQLGRIVPPLKMDVVKMSWHEGLQHDIMLGRTIAVRGPAGNGKSTGVKAVLSTLGYKIYHLDCTDTTTSDQLVGGLVPEPDGKGGIRMVFRDGIFAKAFSDPQAAIQLDEFDALDPRAAMCLQSALQRATRSARRYVSLPDHPEGGIMAQADCPIVVTMNTFGTGATREYVGRNALDAASMDRFDSVIDTGYEQEAGVVKMAGFAKAPLEDIIAAAQKIREIIEKNQLRVLLSTRRLIAIAESMEVFGYTLKEAFTEEFYGRLEKHDQDALKIEFKNVKVAREAGEDMVRFKDPALGDLARYLVKAHDMKLEQAIAILGAEVKEKK